MLWFFTSDSYDIPLPPPTHYIVFTVNHSRFFSIQSTHANCVLAGPCPLWILKSEFVRDFSGGPVVMNPPSNAGDTGWSLVWEDPSCCRVTGVTEPHVPQLPGLREAAAEPCTPEPVLCNSGSHRSEKSRPANGPIHSEDPVQPQVKRLWLVSSQQFCTKWSANFRTHPRSMMKVLNLAWHSVPHLLAVHLFTDVTSIFRDRSEDPIIPLNRWGRWGPSANVHPPSPQAVIC